MSGDGRFGEVEPEGNFAGTALAPLLGGTDARALCGGGTRLNNAGGPARVTTRVGARREPFDLSERVSPQSPLFLSLSAQLFRHETEWLASPPTVTRRRPTG